MFLCEEYFNISSEYPSYARALQGPEVRIRRSHQFDPTRPDLDRLAGSLPIPLKIVMSQYL